MILDINIRKKLHRAKYKYIGLYMHYIYIVKRGFLPLNKKGGNIIIKKELPIRM